MLENAAQIDGRPRRLRAAVTNDPLRLRGLDARSRTGRRRADLIVQFTAALGGRDRITEGQLADVVRAAELMALAEEARLTALKGDSAVDLVGLVRIEGVVDRAVRRLGIPSAARSAEALPPLRERLLGLPTRSGVPPVRRDDAPAGPTPNAATERTGEGRAPPSAPVPRGLENVRVGDRVQIGGVEIEVINDDEAQP
jgi:hypothetical protein